eukprot:1192361-Prorocentrum_minimum.AAC.1
MQPHTGCSARMEVETGSQQSAHSSSSPRSPPVSRSFTRSTWPITVAASRSAVSGTVEATFAHVRALWGSREERRTGRTRERRNIGKHRARWLTWQGTWGAPSGGTWRWCREPCPRGWAGAESLVHGTCGGLGAWWRRSGAWWRRFRRPSWPARGACSPRARRARTPRGPPARTPRSAANRANQGGIHSLRGGIHSLRGCICRVGRQPAHAVLQTTRIKGRFTASGGGFAASGGVFVGWAASPHTTQCCKPRESRGDSQPQGGDSQPQGVYLGFREKGRGCSGSDG